MKKQLPVLAAILFMAVHLQARVEPAEGHWNSWFIAPGKAYRLPAPHTYNPERMEVLAKNQHLDAALLIKDQKAGANACSQTTVIKSDTKCMGLV